MTEQKFYVFFDGSFKVEAHNEEEALEKAYLKLSKLFESFDYDNIEVEPADEEDEEE